MFSILLIFLIGFNAANALENSVNVDADSLKDNVNAQYPGNCAEAVLFSGQSGVYKIQIPGLELKPFYVYCQVDPNGGPAWTVFQRRIDGSIDFFRDWHEYVLGFGNIEGEFFIGLDKLYAMTDATLNELWIQMEDFENQKRFAKYTTFAITDGSQNYTMNVLGQFTGDGGDSLRIHAGQKFSTKDRKNDNFVEDKNCAQQYTGAWWYNACHNSNLNGQYLKGEYPTDKYAQGIDWNSWHGHNYSLKYVHMAIRPIK